MLNENWNALTNVLSHSWILGDMRDSITEIVDELKSNINFFWLYLRIHVANAAMCPLSQ